MTNNPPGFEPLYDELFGHGKSETVRLRAAKQLIQSGDDDAIKRVVHMLKMANKWDMSADYRHGLITAFTGTDRRDVAIACLDIAMNPDEPASIKDAARASVALIMERFAAGPKNSEPQGSLKQTLGNTGRTAAGPHPFF